MGALTKGLIYGTAFFLPGFFLVMHWVDIKPALDEIKEMPVVARLNQEFQTGYAIAGQLFDQHSSVFYGKEFVVSSLNPLSSDRRLDLSLSVWDKGVMESKLSKEFSKGKLRAAKKFLDYIEEYKGLAAYEMATSKIPASITLAQGLLESEAGNSFLAVKANNHFGIKCRKKKGYKADGVIDYDDFYPNGLAIDCVQRSDDNVWDHFEVYYSATDSYRRHTELLTKAGRYNWLIDRYRVGEYYEVERKWFKKDRVPYYAAWAIGIKKSGYATSKRYAQKLAYIIETYELWRIDYGVIEALTVSS